MTLEPEFLQLLACPATRQPLRLATADELAQINAAIAGGSATNRGGVRVERPLQQGLVTRDATLIYPIQDDIPILLTAEGLPMSAAATADPAS